MDHISEELLDEYALGRLSAAETAPVEGHLLVCGLCQDRLQRADEFIAPLREAWLGASGQVPKSHSGFYAASSIMERGAMQPSSERFNRIASNFVTSEVHRSSPTIARLHDLLADHTVNAVCDVACGAGHLGLSFAGKASRIVAVDPAPNMLAAALLAAEEKHVALEVLSARAEALPLPDGEFDLTASRLAPHHFTDVYTGIREMARVTRIGGRVAVIDLEGNENEIYDEFNHRLEVLHDPTHVHSYTATRWRDIFEKAGLVIESLESGLSERPVGVPVRRWCEITSSGEEAETEINRLLREADPGMLSALGIRGQEAVFLMPIRTVLVLARRTGQ